MNTILKTQTEVDPDIEIIKEDTVEKISEYITGLKLIKTKEFKTKFKKAKISSSKEASEYLRKFYKDDISIYESFFILLLDRSSTVKHYVKISQGGVTGTIADPKILCKYAIENLACGVMLCHNHPSDNTQPSQSDRDLTDKIKYGLKLFDIMLIDHIILTESSYFSFADEGII